MVGATSAHFPFIELACHHGVNLCTQRLVDALESLRTAIGKPININDATRCEACNALAGGARNSQHLLGNAADIWVADMTADQLYRAALQVPAFATGGIGVSQGHYIHVDVREIEARWRYDALGRETPWAEGGRPIES
jgi:uncharacterized protein YcbK (DUF882 family)